MVGGNIKYLLDEDTSQKKEAWIRVKKLKHQ